MDLGGSQQHRDGAEPRDQFGTQLAGSGDFQARQIGHLAHRLIGGVELLQAADVQGQHLGAGKFPSRRQMLRIGAPQGDGNRFRVAGSEIRRLIDHGKPKATGIGTLVAAGKVH